jgi:hypothetical protein
VETKIDGFDRWNLGCMSEAMGRSRDPVSKHYKHIRGEVVGGRDAVAVKENAKQSNCVHGGRLHIGSRLKASVALGRRWGGQEVDWSRENPACSKGQGTIWGAGATLPGQVRRDECHEQVAEALAFEDRLRVETCVRVSAGRWKRIWQ